ncbi:MAG: nitroreductase family protein [Pseudomonadota bacterium]
MAFNDISSPLHLLLTRRSGKARDMVAPGPSPEEMTRILAAAMRVPDHGKLAPWRFILVPRERQAALGDEIAAAYLMAKPNAGRLEVKAMRDFPQQAPALVVLISQVREKRDIPEWEQRLSAGAAGMAMLLAAHAQGYVGNWLTGWAAYSQGVVELLGGAPEDRIAGFFFFGTPSRPLSERPRPAYDEVVTSWRG